MPGTLATGLAAVIKTKVSSIRWILASTACVGGHDRVLTAYVLHASVRHADAAEVDVTGAANDGAPTRVGRSHFGLTDAG